MDAAFAGVWRCSSIMRIFKYYLDGYFTGVAKNKYIKIRRLFKSE